jgi:predicted RNA-binding protein with PUA-like domain
MKYWLLKSDPDAWAWNDQVRDRVTAWTGVRNHQAAAFLKAMQVGDQAFFYHSQSDKAIVGIVRIEKQAYPDPTDATHKFVCVDVGTVAPLEKPVTLAQIKADPLLATLPLVRQSRLSVMPIDAASWKKILKLGSA